MQTWGVQQTARLLPQTQLADPSDVAEAQPYQRAMRVLCTLLTVQRTELRCHFQLLWSRRHTIPAGDIQISCRIRDARLWEFHLASSRVSSGGNE